MDGTDCIVAGLVILLVLLSGLAVWDHLRYHRKRDNEVAAAIGKPVEREP